MSEYIPTTEDYILYISKQNDWLSKKKREFEDLLDETVTYLEARVKDATDPEAEELLQRIERAFDFYENSDTAERRER